MVKEAILWTEIHKSGSALRRPLLIVMVIILKGVDSENGQFSENRVLFCRKESDLAETLLFLRVSPTCSVFSGPPGEGLENTLKHRRHKTSETSTDL